MNKTNCVCVISLLILTSFGFFANPVAANGTPGWDTAALIETDDIGNAFQPDIVMDIDGNAIAVWSQWDGSRMSLFANRFEIGIGWGMPELIENNNSGDARAPQVTINNNGSATVVYEQLEGWIRTDIWANRYDAATGWGTAELIETNDSGDAYLPQVAMGDNGNAIAVWQHSNGSGWNIWANLYEAGIGWGTAELIKTNDSVDARYPQLAMDGNGNAIAVWQQNDGFLNNISANRYEVGIGWGTAELIETNDSGFANYPMVAMDDNSNAIVVWSHWDGWIRNDIWANRYDAATGWGTAELIETNNSGFAENPRVAMDSNGNAIAVWSQYDGLRNNISANRYEVGIGWGNATFIATNNLWVAGNPQVAIDGNGNAIVVWWQWNGAQNNVWANRYEIGIGWGTAELIQANPSEWCDPPQVAIDDLGNAIAVWPQWVVGWIRSDIWANHFNVPPFLAITNPANGEITNTTVITVSGKTEPNVDLTVNGLVIAVGLDGAYSLELALKDGSNTINAKATDYAGLSTSKSVTVIFNNPLPGLADELSDAMDELSVTKDELNTTQNDLSDISDELETTQNDLSDISDELETTKSDIENLQSQLLIFIAILTAFVVLSVVMSVMYMNLRKKIGRKPINQEPPLSPLK